jgi:transmembrane E3 ubiquitin-protein ligase
MEMEKYYAKAVNFVLLMSFVSLFLILLVISQITATNTPAVWIVAIQSQSHDPIELIPLGGWLMQSAAKVSLLCIGMQAVMDSYTCLLHLITAILMGMSNKAQPHARTHTHTHTHTLSLSLSLALAQCIGF